jgi:hypothetical protein
MNNDATAKITMLNGSRRCFVFGVISLVPILGLPFAISSLWTAGCVRGLEKRFWNAAKPYRLWGITCAVIGIVVGLGAFTLYAIATYNAACGE